MAKQRSKNPYRNKTYTRAVVISLKDITQTKEKQLKHLIRNFRIVVNAYLDKLYHVCLNMKGENSLGFEIGLNANTLALIPSHYCDLSERYKSQALKQALETLGSIDKKKSEQEYQAKHGQRKAKCPKWNGFPVLDAKFVDIRKTEIATHFDYSARVSTLKKGKPIELLFKGTKVLNKWLAKPKAKLLDSCELHANKLILYVQVPIDTKTELDSFSKPPHYRKSLINMVNTGFIKPKEVWGLDMGINKVMVLTNQDQATPDTQAIALFEGLWQQALLDKRLRKKRGSKTFRRATKEYHNKIGELLNQLPWHLMKILVVERLTHIKYKKQFKKLLLWLVSSMLERLAHKALEHRVYLIKVSPRNTSRTCPACRTVEKTNRQGELYVCPCNQVKLDADFVGAYNVRRRFLEATGYNFN